MRKFWTLMAALLCLIAAGCSDTPEEVIVGVETPEAAADTADAGGVAVESDEAIEEVDGTPWIDPRDAVFEAAGGQWANDDFDFQPRSIASYSAPFEITPLTDEQLDNCNLFQFLFDTNTPLVVDDTAYLEDGGELEQAVFDRGGDAARIEVALQSYTDRCPTWQVDSEVVFEVLPLEVDADAVTISFVRSDGDERFEAFISTAVRENIVSLIALVGSNSEELDSDDLAEFERVIGLQLDALAEAPVQYVTDRVPAPADVVDSAGDAAGDAADAVDEAMADSESEAALRQAEEALAEAEAAKAAAEAAMRRADAAEAAWREQHGVAGD